MGDKDLTIERVVQVVRERGPLANREICAALGCYGADPSRALDRLLQKARKAGLLRCSGGRWVASVVETDAEKIARLEWERDETRGSLEFYEDREKHFAKLLSVTDGGQYRNDWDVEIERILKERDAAIADRAAMQSAIDAAMVEHSTLEAERARLTREVGCLLDAARNAIPESEHPKEQTAGNWAFQLRALGEDRRAAYRLNDKLTADRDSLRAQLAALTAEHDDAARAAEDRIGRLTEALGRIAAFRVVPSKSDERTGGNHDDAYAAGYDAGDAATSNHAADIADAALAEVKP